MPSLQRRITTPMFGRTPVPGSALRPSPQRAYMVHVLIRHPGLPTSQTLVQELPQTTLPDQPAAVHSSPAAVSAPVRLPVQLFARLHVPVPNAPPGTPHFFLAAGIDTPLPHALWSCQPHVSPVCQQRRQYSSRKLKFRQPGAILRTTPAPASTETRICVAGGYSPIRAAQLPTCRFAALTYV